jgi:hypothetical protein
MSISLVKRIRDGDLPGWVKPIAIVIVTYADEQHGGDIFPSIDLVADRMQVSRPTAKRVFRYLRQHGILTPVGSITGGRGKTIRYRGNKDAIRPMATFNPPDRRQPQARKGVTTDPLLDPEKGSRVNPFISWPPNGAERKGGQTGSQRGSNENEKGVTTDPRSIRDQPEDQSEGKKSARSSARQKKDRAETPSRCHPAHPAGRRSVADERKEAKTEEPKTEERAATKTVTAESPKPEAVKAERIPPMPDPMLTTMIDLAHAMFRADAMSKYLTIPEVTPKYTQFANQAGCQIDPTRIAEAIRLADLAAARVGAVGR